ncbi:MAG: hypothetical protein ABJE63_08925 [Lentilitoribacter sp.]
MIGMIRLFTSEILPPSLLGANSQSCHGPSCFCYAKNVEAPDVVFDSSAFGTRPAIVHYLQKDHRKDNSIYPNISKSIDLIHSQIGLTELLEWIRNQNSKKSGPNNKTDCLMGFAFGKAQSNRSCFGFAYGVSQMHPLSSTFSNRTKFSYKRNFPTWLSHSQKYNVLCKTLYYRVIH